MAKQNRVENERAWRLRVAKSSRHPGGVAEYCRLHGVSRASLRYWQKRISGRGRERSLGGVMPAEAFVEVQVERESEMPALPDARWLAELIVHLSRASAR